MNHKKKLLILYYIETWIQLKNCFTNFYFLKLENSKQNPQNIILFKIAYKRSDFYSYWKVVFTALIFYFNMQMVIYKLVKFLMKTRMAI